MDSPKKKNAVDQSANQTGACDHAYLYRFMNKNLFKKNGIQDLKMTNDNDFLDILLFFFFSFLIYIFLKKKDGFFRNNLGTDLSLGHSINFNLKSKIDL